MAAIYMRAEAVIIAYGMGITQHRHERRTSADRDLLLMRGNIGSRAPAFAPCAVTPTAGRSTMGVDEKPKAALLDQLREVFDFEPRTPARKRGGRRRAAMIDGRAKSSSGWAATSLRRPRTSPWSKHMRRLRLTVGSLRAQSRPSVHGQQSLILPCLARATLTSKRGRQSITVEDSMSMCTPPRPRRAPQGSLKSEVPSCVAWRRATLRRTTIGWSAFEEDYDVNSRNPLEDVFPDLFHDFNGRIRHRAALSSQPGARAEMAYAERPRPVYRLRITGKAAPPRLDAVAAATIRQPTISTTPRSTPSTTVIGACSGDAGSCDERGGHEPARDHPRRELKWSPLPATAAGGCCGTS